MMTQEVPYQPAIGELRWWSLFCDHDHQRCECSNCQWLRLRKQNELRQEPKQTRTNNLETPEVFRFRSDPVSLGLGLGVSQGWLAEEAIDKIPQKNDEKKWER